MSASNLAWDSRDDGKKPRVFGEEARRVDDASKADATTNFVCVPDVMRVSPIIAGGEPARVLAFMCVRQTDT